MRHRNSGISRDRNCRSHTRNHLKRNPRLLQTKHLFTAATKYKGIATFQAHHPFSLFRFFHQKFIDRLLRSGMSSRSLSDRDFLRFFRQHRQNLFSNQRIIYNQIRFFYYLFSSSCQKSAASRASPCQPYFSLFHLSCSSICFSGNMGLL